MKRKWILAPLTMVSDCLSKKSRPGTEFDFQGHRGCRGLMPENTIPAMIHAVDLGVTTLEMDVVVTKDNRILVSHEPYFSHEISTLAKGDAIPVSEERKYNIYQMVYDEIKLIDVGLKPHARFRGQAKQKAVKPLLTDLIDSVESYLKKNNFPKVNYNIEIKSTKETDRIFHPAPDEFVDLLLTVIYEKNMASRIAVQSFDIRPLQVLHNRDSTLQIALLREEQDRAPLDSHLEKLGFTPSVFSPHYSSVNAALVEQCHRAGIRIIPWTVNDLETMKNLKALGVDGLISDYPDKYKYL